MTEPVDHWNPRPTPDGIDAGATGRPGVGAVILSDRRRTEPGSPKRCGLVFAAITAGSAVGSLALVGFGGDSTSEVVAAVLVVLWRLHDVSEDREDRALKLIGVGFLLLAVGIVVQSVRGLAAGVSPEVSVVGIVLTGVSLVVMPLLARAKQTVGRAMNTRVVLADAVETWLCTWVVGHRVGRPWPQAAFGGGGPTRSPSGPRGRR